MMYKQMKHDLYNELEPGIQEEEKQEQSDILDVTVEWTFTSSYLRSTQKSIIVH